MMAILLLLLALFGLLHTPSLSQDFRRFEERAEEQLGGYARRAADLDSLESWDYYMQLGLEAERTIWEAEAAEHLLRQESYLRERLAPQEATREMEDLYRRYQAALLEWEIEAEEHILIGRGIFQARASLSVAPAAQEQYESLLLEIEATLLAEMTLDLEGYEELWQRGSQELYQQFEAELHREIEAISVQGSDLPGLEALAFEKGLEQVQEELIAIFRQEEQYYRLKGRNRHRASIASENLSAKLRAKEEAAGSQAEAIIQSAETESRDQTDLLLEEALAELILTPHEAGVEQSPLLAWEASVEATINVGLKQWEEAEEQLYRLQLQWLQSHREEREKARQIWEEHHERLRAARSSWLKELQEKITFGEMRWQQKLQQFEESRRLAQEELERYVEEELLRREKIAEQLDSMVSGGGGALAEIEEARRYYREMLAELPSPEDCPPSAGEDMDARLACFYKEQQDVLTASLDRFERILAGSDDGLIPGVETLLWENLHSESPSQGLLKDKRSFAGELPQEIAQLPAADFRQQLAEMISNKSEQYLLYRRDLEALIARNSLFTARTRELSEKADFRWQEALDISELKREIDNLDEGYAEHQRELSSIVERAVEDHAVAAATQPASATALSTDLAIALEEITKWFAHSSDENGRLKQQTELYFQQGYRGFYLTASENDPYLMTRAEYEWELLRRERNYFARQLESAEAVKRYADFAMLHSAGTEVAHVTAERAEIARLQLEARELYYQALKGDLQLQGGESRAEDQESEGATGGAAPLAEEQEGQGELLAELLQERSIDLDYIAAQKELLQAEIDILREIGQMAEPPDEELSRLEQDIASFLQQYVHASSGLSQQGEAGRHRLSSLYQRIGEHLSQQGQERSQNWQMIQINARFLLQEVEDLRQSYHFLALDQDILALNELHQIKPISEYRTSLEDTGELLAENAEQLLQAERQLEAARTHYRQIRQEFDTLRAYNADELIQKALVENIARLAEILNRSQVIGSQVIGDMPGLSDQLFDPVTEAHIQYLQAISSSIQAQREHSFAKETLREIAQLEEARRRRHLYEDLAGQSLDGMDEGPEEILSRSAALLASRDDLVATGREDERENSFQGVQALFLLLEQNWQAYRNYRDMVTAEGASEQTAEAALEAGRGLLAQIGLQRTMAALQVALEGEEQARLMNVEHLLEGSAVSLEERKATLQEQTSQIAQQVERQVAEAAANLRQHLNGNRETSFSDLLSQISAALAGEAALQETEQLPPPDPALTPDAGTMPPIPPAPSAPIPPMLQALSQESLEIMLAWMLNAQMELEAASVSPDGWQELLAKFDAADIGIYEQLTAEAHLLLVGEIVQISSNARGIQELERKSEAEELRYSNTIEVKRALGYYRIEEGSIEQDGDGQLVYDDNFLDRYNIRAPEEPPLTALGGGLNGLQLEELTDRLLSYFDKDDTDLVVAVAIEGLESAWRELASARLFIERRDDDPAQLLEEARNSLPPLRALYSKALALSAFYDDLDSILQEEQQPGSSEQGLARLTAEVESERGEQILLLFAGYDFDGDIDGYIDTEAQMQVEELLALLQGMGADQSLAPLLEKIGEQRIYISYLLRDYERQLALMEYLYDHALTRGANLTEETEDQQASLLLNRFASYRSYLPAGEKRQIALYQNYLKEQEAEGGAEPPQEFAEFIEGKYLEIEAVEVNPLTLFADPSWQQILLSDSIDYSEPRTIDGDMPEENGISYPKIQFIGSQPEGQEMSSEGEGQEASEEEIRARMQYAFHANLANHWLEALTRLNRAINRVFFAASISDQRLSSDPSQALYQQLQGYDPSAENRNYDQIDAQFQQALNEAADREMEHGSAWIDGRRTEIERRLIEREEVSARYALAGRQDQLKDQALLHFLDDVYRPAASAMNTALARYEQLNDRSEELKHEYEQKSGELIENLNKMALRYRRYEAARREYEMRSAVKDFAETAYLYQGAPEEAGGVDRTEADGTQERDILTERAADARRQFELATAALELADHRLQDAAFRVQSEERLPQFHAVLEGLERGESYLPLEPQEAYQLELLKDIKYRQNRELTPDQESHLARLSERDIYQRYEQLITSRAEHIRQSLRMVRLSKTAHIVNAEIRRLELVVEAKRGAYETELQRQFGSFEEESEVKARNAAYMRLAAAVEEQAPHLYDEFRAWYWIENESSGHHDKGYGDLPNEQKDQAGWLKDRPTQREELERGRALYALVPEAERQILKRWIEKAEQAGNVAASLGAFKGLYLSLLQKMGERDYRRYRYNPVALGIWSPVIAEGIRQIVIGFSTCGFLGSCNWPLIALGVGMVATGAYSIDLAKKIYEGADRAMRHAEQAAKQLTVDVRDQVRLVMERQREYEEAKAQLDYFTSVDLQTLKRRLIQWGAERKEHDADRGLYRITDEDLKYVYDLRTDGSRNYTDQNGEQQSLSLAEQEESLDVSALLKERDFLDSYGRRYDPRSIISEKPGELVGGIYHVVDEEGNSLQYTRILISHSDGAVEYGYARLLQEGEVAEAYSMGEMLASIMEHGGELQERHRQNYIAAGDRIAEQQEDTRLILSERDSTFAALFRSAAEPIDGGREYAGYQMTYRDYGANQREIMQKEVDQKKRLLFKEWEIRAVELEEQHSRWQQKMALIEERGHRNWNMAEDRYLQTRRRWEKETDTAEERAFELREREIVQHFESRERWQKEMQAQISQTALDHIGMEGIQELSRQVRHLKLAVPEQQGLLLSAEEMVQRLRGETFLKVEQLSNVNDEIENFKTILNINLAGRLGEGAQLAQLASLSGRYRESMRQQQKDMRIYANIEIQQQYLALIELLTDQIEQMNRQYDAQSANAAYSAGAYKAGDQFVLKGSSSSAGRSIDRYHYFRGRQAIEEGLLKAGYEFLPQEGVAESAGASRSDYYDSMFRYLGDRETVEVEAYFRSLSNKAQELFDQIVGSGSQEERQNSREERIVGTFGLWSGEAPDWHKDKGARPLGFEYRNGFGELGAHGDEQAHSGRKAGFYYQLYNAQREIAEEDGKALQAPLPLQLLMVGGANSGAILIANSADLLAESYLQGDVGGQQIGIVRNGIAYAGGSSPEALALADFSETLLQDSIEGHYSQEAQVALAGGALSYFGVPFADSSLLRGLQYSSEGEIIGYDVEAAALSHIGPAAEIAHSLYNQAMGYESSLQDTLLTLSIVALRSIDSEVATGGYEENGEEALIQQILSQQIKEELKLIFGTTTFRQIAVSLALSPLREAQEHDQRRQAQELLMGLAHLAARRYGFSLEQINLEQIAGEYGFGEEAALLGGVEELIDQLSGDFLLEEWNDELEGYRPAQFIESIREMGEQFESIGQFESIAGGIIEDQAGELGQHLSNFFGRDYDSELLQWRDSMVDQIRNGEMGQHILQALGGLSQAFGVTRSLADQEIPIEAITSSLNKIYSLQEQIQEQIYEVTLQASEKLGVDPLFIQPILTAELAMQDWYSDGQSKIISELDQILGYAGERYRGNFNFSRNNTNLFNTNLFNTGLFQQAVRGGSLDRYSATYNNPANVQDYTRRIARYMRQS